VRDARSAARRLLAEHGVDGVTMVAVAKEVGIAGPTAPC
jgi:AcrR family transcriptional regulator